MSTKAYGRMVFWEGASLWVLGTRPGEGPYPKTKFHAHHAVQVTLSLRGWFTLENRDRQVGGDAAAVAPDAEHALAGEGMVAHLYVDPEGEAGREMQRTFFSGETLVSIPAAGLAGLPARLRAGFEAPDRSDQTLIDLGRILLAKLAPGSERDERPEARVRRMSAWADAGSLFPGIDGVGRSLDELVRLASMISAKAGNGAAGSGSAGNGAAGSGAAGEGVAGSSAAGHAGPGTTDAAGAGGTSAGGQGGMSAGGTSGGGTTGGAGTTGAAGTARRPPPYGSSTTTM